MKIFIYYPLKRGGFKPQFFDKIDNLWIIIDFILNF